MLNMSTSQYEKRKAKNADTVKAEIEAKREDIRADGLREPVYTNTGYDVYTPDGGKSHKVVEFAYNPKTGEAKVADVFDISRIIALSYENQKQALGILKKKGR